MCNTVTSTVTPTQNAVFEYSQRHAVNAQYRHMGLLSNGTGNGIGIRTGNGNGNLCVLLQRKTSTIVVVQSVQNVWSTIIHEVVCSNKTGPFCSKFYSK
jgi:hypothetical protein